MNGLRQVESTGEITTSTPEEFEEPWSYLDVQLPEDYLFKVPALHARLNSSGTHVVCGTVDCGTRMAAVHVADGTNYRYLQFLPGWAPRRDRVWVFSRHAKLRSRHGLSVKGRRDPLDWIPSHNSVMDSGFDPLPARAMCQECKLPNILTRRGLGAKVILWKPSPPKPSRISHR